MLLSESLVCTLRAAMERIVPGGGSRHSLESEEGMNLLGLLRQRFIDPEMISGGLSCLERESVASYGMPFPNLSADEQDDVLAAIELGSVITRWTVLPGMFLRTLVDYAFECSFGLGADGHAATADVCPFLNFEVTS